MNQNARKRNSTITFLELLIYYFVPSQRLFLVTWPDSGRLITRLHRLGFFPFFFFFFLAGWGGGGIPWTNMGQEQVKYAQTSNIKIELSALYRIQIKFASMSRVETPQTENDSSNDYKQFKLQEAKQQDLHYVYERERESAHTHTRIHTHTAQHSTAHS